MKNPLNSYGFGMPWEDAYRFSQAILTGSTLYVSGQLSHDMDVNFVGEGDFELQVRTTFSNLDKILSHYNARKEHIVQTMVYVKNLREYFDDIVRLHGEYFGEHRPTSTLLGVAELALPPQLVEIGAIAVFDQQ